MLIQSLFTRARAYYASLKKISRFVGCWSQLNARGGRVKRMIGGEKIHYVKGRDGYALCGD